MAIATLLVELQLFQVPNYAIEVARVGRRQDGFQETAKHHLSELNMDTLDRMCNEFRRGVFEKAGKPDPRLPRNYVFQECQT